MAHEMTFPAWYSASTSGGQGLIVDEGDGRNVAVAYDAADAALIAAAPDLARLGHELAYGETSGHRMNEILAEFRAIMCDIGKGF